MKCSYTCSSLHLVLMFQYFIFFLKFYCVLKFLLSIVLTCYQTCLATFGSIDESMIVIKQRDLRESMECRWGQNSWKGSCISVNIIECRYTPTNVTSTCMHARSSCTEESTCICNLLRTKETLLPKFATDDKIHEKKRNLLKSDCYFELYLHSFVSLCHHK